MFSRGKDILFPFYVSNFTAFLFIDYQYLVELPFIYKNKVITNRVEITSKGTNILQ